MRARPSKVGLAVLYPRLRVWIYPVCAKALPDQADVPTLSAEGGRV